MKKKSLLIFLIGVISLQVYAQGNDKPSDIAAIKVVLKNYVKAFNDGDTVLAAKVWETSDQVSLINPASTESGWINIRHNFYVNLMFANFSIRNLSILDPVIHTRGNSAWVVFNWDFKATQRKDDKPFNSQGRESQFFIKEKGQWRLVQDHYSGMPIKSGNKRF